MSGIAFRRLRGEDGVNKGVALVATEDKGAKESNLDVLLQIPSDLVLSLDCVETCAKSDPYLREILEAVGGFGKVDIYDFFSSLFLLNKKKKKITMWHENAQKDLFMLNVYRQPEAQS